MTTLPGLLAASRAIQSGALDPEDYVQQCARRADEVEPWLHAFVSRASLADMFRNIGDGPLAGIPVGVKDLVATVDLPTTMGSPIYVDHMATCDAAIVTQIRQLGGVVFGKTVTTEFAATEPRGTRNPHDLERTPGGSSSGSAAAVGAGMLPLALGTQVIGSILRPSSFCGCVGFKPTMGAINRGGSHDGLSQSAHGVLAASIEDAWISLREIADRVGGDPGCAGLFGPAEVPLAALPTRLIVLDTPGWRVATEQAKAQREGAVARLARAGVAMRSRQNDPVIEALEVALERANPVSRAINGWESVWPMGSYADKDAAKLSQSMQGRLAESLQVTLDDYRTLLAERLNARALYARLMSDHDGCVTLSAPGAAPKGLGSTGNPAFNVPASYLGTPAITLPVLQDESLPLGLQLIGAADQDARVFSNARAISALFD